MAEPRFTNLTSLCLGSRTIDFGRKPLIMGVVNMTPDSFYDGGKYNNPRDAIKKIASLVNDGADIIDIGGESTRPGSSGVSLQEETDRIAPVIESAVAEFDVPVSVDTTKALVAEEALRLGACVVNDISGLEFEPEIAHTAARNGASLILGHTTSCPLDMQEKTSYRDLIPDVIESLMDSAGLAESAGVPRERIIIDPGIGFGKTVEQNLEILRNIEIFCGQGFSVCAGASRKSFIGTVLGNSPPEKRLIGSVSSAIILMLKGISIIRVHDVLETAQAVRTVKSIYGLN